ncbi:MAG: M36 family metallopeptidase, partial [Myxococcota bacterium]
MDGSGALRGDWVDAEAAHRSIEPTLTFAYDRSQPGFEQVMAYWHLDRVQDRLQSLGFTDANARPQPVLVNGSSADNAWFDPSTGVITTGTGGVDDAEDADVLVHEYAHALQDAITAGWGDGPDAAAFGEGFADYLAASVADTASNQLGDPACVAEWDGAAFAVPCIRRVDGSAHWPEDWDDGALADPHANGEVWSAALWSARAGLGADLTDSLALEALYGLPADPSTEAVAAALLDTAEALYDTATRDVVRRALIAHGLSREISDPSVLSSPAYDLSLNIASPHPGGSYAAHADLVATIHEPGAAALSVRFRGYDTEPEDFVYVTNGDGDLYHVLTGRGVVGFTTAVIPGDTVH